VNTLFNSTIGNQQKIIGQTPTNLTYELKSTRRKSMYAFIPDAKTRKSATAKPSSQQHSVAADKRSSNTTTNVSSENAEEGIDRISTLPDNILARMHPHPIEYHRGHADDRDVQHMVVFHLLSRLQASLHQ
jgi:hypothetical protein